MKLMNYETLKNVMTKRGLAFAAIDEGLKLELHLVAVSPKAASVIANSNHPFVRLAMTHEPVLRAQKWWQS